MILLNWRAAGENFEDFERKFTIFLQKKKDIFMISSKFSLNFPTSAGQTPKYPMRPPFSEFSFLSWKISLISWSEMSKIKNYSTVYVYVFEWLSNTMQTRRL